MLNTSQRKANWACQHHSYIIVRRRAQETTRFRKSKALGCGVPSVARNATTGPEAF